MSRSRKPLARNFSAPKKCGGKFCYATLQQAKLVVEEKNITNPEITLSIYRCLSCGEFHLTRSEPPTTI